MAPAFDPKMIEEFQKGIRTRDIERVQTALDAGVDPSTPIDGHHPLLLLLYVEYSRSQAKVEGKMSYEQFHESSSKLVELLLARGVKLVEEEKYATGGHQYLVDKLLSSPRLADVSTVVLHAISQSLAEKGCAYQPDTNRFIIAHLIDVARKGDDYKAHITNALNMLETVHKIVRQRLEIPQEGSIEHALVTRYNNQLDYWTHAFERPPLRRVFAEMELGNPDLPPSAASGRTEARPQAKAKAKAEENMSQFVKVLPKKSPQQVLADMDELVGMEEAKGEARALVLRSQFDAARKVGGLKITPQVMHTVLEGNPGTGKTTVARHRAELLHSLGLAGNRYVEISRENMVGQFVGHTEKNMTDLFNQADVIFIDEAYNLVGDKNSKVDFGNRVVDALMNALENRRDKLTIFFAGYPKEMEEFLASNPGLKSRITHYQHLPDYSTEELGKIMDGLLKKAGMKMESDAREYALTQLEAAKNAMGPRDFGNARIVRTLVEQLPNKMAERLFSQEGREMTSGLLVVPGPEELSTVKLADVKALNLKEKMGVKAPGRKVVGFKGSWSTS